MRLKSSWPSPHPSLATRVALIIFSTLHVHFVLHPCTFAALPPSRSIRFHFASCSSRRRSFQQSTFTSLPSHPQKKFCSDHHPRASQTDKASGFILRALPRLRRSAPSFTTFASRSNSRIRITANDEPPHRLEQILIILIEMHATPNLNASTIRSASTTFVRLASFSRLCLCSCLVFAVALVFVFVFAFALARSCSCLLLFLLPVPCSCSCLYSCSHL